MKDVLEVPRQPQTCLQNQRTPLALLNSPEKPKPAHMGAGSGKIRCSSLSTAHIGQAQAASKPDARSPEGMIAVSNKQVPTKFRKLIPGRCQYCGRQFFSDKRTGRPRLFCDKRCRDGEFRRSRYLTSKNGESVSKKEVNSETYKGFLGYRPSPLNILGGYRWHLGIAIDGNLLNAIIRAEIGGATL